MGIETDAVENIFSEVFLLLFAIVIAELLYGY